MPIHSMTGYASSQAQLPPDPDSGTAGWRLGLEIRSVNSRFLDLTFKMPDELRAHETALREIVTAQLRRGKVEVRVQLESASASGLGLPSPTWLQQLAQAQTQVHAVLPQATPLSVADALRLGQGASTTPADVGTPLLALTRDVVQALQAARSREGERLSAMLRERLTQLRELAQRAAPLIPQLVEQQRQRFLERWRDALAQADAGVSNQTVQERALSEATAFAIRIDVAEELSRLAAHLAEIDDLLAQGGKTEGVGKRLDFLIQELHRAANTLGSKSATMELTRISVDMKVLIEQLREQVQNLE